MLARLTQELRFVRAKLTRRNVGELAWVTVGQAITLLMGLVTTKLLTSMGKAEYGTYALTLTAGALLSQTLHGPVQQGYTRFYYQYAGSGGSRQLLRLLYEFHGWSAVAIIGIAACFAGGALLLGDPKLAAVGFITGFAVIALKADEFFNAALNIARRRRENYILQGVQRLVAGGVLFAIFISGALQLIPAMIALTAVTFVAVWAKARNLGRHLPTQSTTSDVPPPSKAQMFAEIRSYVTPFMIWGCAGWLQFSGEKWIVAKYLSTADVGVYAVVQGVTTLFLTVPNGMLMELMVPVIFRYYADPLDRAKHAEGHRYIRWTVLAVLGLTAVSAIATHFAGRSIIVLISSEAFTEYAGLLPMLCAGAGLFLAGQAMACVGMALNRPRIYLVPKILVGLVSVPLHLVLIKAYGVAGVAYTAMVIGCVYVVHVAYVNRRLLRELAAANR